MFGRIKFIHHFTALISLLLIFSSLIFQYNYDSQPAHAETGTQCDTTAQFGDLNTSLLYSGEFETLVFYAPLQMFNINVEKVSFLANGEFIGAINERTNGYWELSPWDTTANQKYSNGPVSLTAQLYANSSDVICSSMPTQINVFNDLNTIIQGELFIFKEDPTSNFWSGFVNTSKDFKVRAIWDTGENQVVDPSNAGYLWTLESEDGVGDLQASSVDKKAVTFFTGPVAGDAELTVRAEYNGEIATQTFFISVYDNDSTGSSIYTEPTDDEIESILDDVEEDGSVDDESSDTVHNNPLVSDIDVARCLIAAVGEDRFKEIVSGEERLTFDELEIVDTCFVTTRFVFPAYIAPVEPVDILRLKVKNTAAKIKSIEQINGSDDSSVAIRISGTALPNKTLAIYIFSEPLVLTTTSDSEGNWTYILEDPLAPGEHEVYVAVETDNSEVVRSEVQALSIQPRPANLQSNPAGLSLTLNLTEASGDPTIYYVSAVAALLLVGLGLYIFIIRRKTNMLEPGPDLAQSEAQAKKET